MEVAVVTGLFAKWDVDVDAAHLVFSFQFEVSVISCNN